MKVMATASSNKFQRCNIDPSTAKHRHLGQRKIKTVSSDTKKRTLKGQASTSLLTLGHESLSVALTLFRPS